MTESYILNTNEKARDRLSLQHELYARSSVGLLNEAGIRSGMKVLEIGCGSGAMTLELAKLIGSQGSLLAIDLSQAQLDHVQKLTEAHRNIRFKLWDVNYLTDLGEQFDFIYCRMVLHHVADAHPVIQQIRSCLKPGGIIVCEEPSIFDSTFCSPPSEAYIQFTQWARNCFISNKRDFEIAHRLEQEFASSDFNVTHHSLYQPLLRTSREKEIYSMALDDLTPQLLESGLASQEEINHLSQELKNLASSNSTMCWIRMHRLIAQAS
ncbi:class I SAM-dependent methyltransferase [Legionella shakespearei]|uniref:Putative methyltransferase n=1 Tax=Legionella shakespearei DSM 23087 TaxID=1122169 RepID=A0A0W0Z1N1_9GAMM|nr:class I SAM-dependent methyltransferase [Legionella shakespearei]KTD62767.1 putative methyltransferase [Legionella shakespearei DSM 23087]